MTQVAQLEEAKQCIYNADALVIGIGSGLSAAGGLDYTSEAFLKTHYSQYANQGFKHLFEVLTFFWVTQINEENATRYWSFWAQHINTVRYASDITKPYQTIQSILQKGQFDNTVKDYFIITTNGDHQTQRAFGEENVFAPQGNYGYVQCARACTDEVYSSEDMIKNMLSLRPNGYEIRKEDIPRCPHCGAFIIPNLRCDNNFIETPHLVNMEKYTDFLNRFIPAREEQSQLHMHPFALPKKKFNSLFTKHNTSSYHNANVGDDTKINTQKNAKTHETEYHKKLLFLELGVGYNTPTIIRFPFNQITQLYKNTRLIRINGEDADVLGKNIGLKMDLNDALDRLL